MSQEYVVGQHVVFVDSLGKRHDALVTVWWFHGPGHTSKDALVPGTTTPYGEAGCNLVYVEGDEAKIDSYGRQISRTTSVVHKTRQGAHGMYWCWPNE